MIKHFFTCLTIALYFLSSSVNASTGFVTNKGNNTVSVIDSSMGQIVHNIGVGDAPQALVLSADESTLYVANTDSNTISVINANSYEVISIIDSNLLSAPNTLAIDPQGRYLAVGNGGNNNLVIINLHRNPYSIASFNLGFSTAPRSIDVVPQGTLLYIPNPASNTVSVVNMSVVDNPSLLTTVTVEDNPAQVVVSPSSFWAAVANKGSDTVSIISTISHQVLKTVTVGSGPSSLSFNYDSSRIYVTNPIGNFLSTIDLNPTDSIPVESAPNQMAVSPDGQKAYVANTGSNSVSVIDTTTFQEITTVPISIYPRRLLVTPDSSKVYLSEGRTSDNPNENTRIVSIDTTTYETAEINLNHLVTDLAVHNTTLVATLPYQLQVQLINTTNNALIGRVTTFDNPYNNDVLATRVVAHPTLARAYVLNETRWSFITVIDLDSLTTITDVNVGRTVNNLAITPNGDFVLSVNAGSQSFYGPTAGRTDIIDTTTNTLAANPITGFAATHTASTSNSDYIYVANGGQGTLNVPTNSIFVTSTLNNNFHTSNVLSLSTRDMTITPNDQLMYLIPTNGNNLYSVSIGLGGALSLTRPFSLEVGSSPRNLQFSLDSQFAFVTSQDTNSVFVILADPNAVNPLAASLFNTTMPILGDVTVSTVHTVYTPEIVVPDTPVAPDSPPILPGVPTPDPAPEPEPTPDPEPRPPEEPPEPISSDSDTVWIVNPTDDTVTIGHANGSNYITVIGLDNPSDIVVTLKKEYLLKAVFTLNEINHAWCSERFANLLWSGFPGALEYKLYRNNEFLASFDSSVNQYQDHNLEFNKNYTYTLYICTATGALQAYQFELIEDF